MLSLVLMALVSLPQTHTPGQKLVGTAPGAKDMIQIDGAKEPHRIPEWSAWRNVFELLAGGTTKDHLPSSLTPLVSAADVDLIFRAIDASKRNDAAYDEHRLKMFHRLLEVPDDVRQAGAHRSKAARVSA